MRNGLAAAVLITHYAFLIPNCSSGAVANIVDILRTLKQKAIDSANDSNTDDDRRIMQKEVDQLLDQIDDNALVTFNGKTLVNGAMNGLSFPVGAVWVAEGLYAPDENEWTNGSYYFDKKLTDLKARDGNSLRIEETDVFTITHVVNGKTYTRTEKVGDYTLSNLCYGTVANNFYWYPNEDGGAHSAAGRVQTSIPLARHSGSGWTDAGRIPVESHSFTRVSYDHTGVALYDGSSVGGLTSATTFHVGAGANQSMTVGLSDMRSKALGLKSADGSQTISIKTRDDALAAINALDNVLNGALDQLTSIGALEARIEYTIGNITTSVENVQASDSTNRDADMAREMTAYTRDNILTQAAQAMLAQANQEASSILGLLS